MLITRQAGIGDLHFGAQKQKFQWCTMDLKTYPLQRWTQVFKSDRGIICFTTQVGATVVLESVSVKVSRKQSCHKRSVLLSSTTPFS